MIIVSDRVLESKNNSSAKPNGAGRGPRAGGRFLNLYGFQRLEQAVDLVYPPVCVSLCL